MELTLAIISIVLALAFAAAGLMKLRTSREELMAKMPWAEHFSAGQIRLIGAAELLGGLGVAAPLLGLPDVVAAAAAIGLTVMMVGAIATHLRIKDPVAQAAPALVLGALAAWVAFSRATM